MGGDHQDAPAPEVAQVGEMSESESLDEVSADRQMSNDGRPSTAQSDAAGRNFEGRPEESSSDSKQKGKAPMVLQEREGLESLMRSMLTSLRRIELLLEGQQKDIDPRRKAMREDNGDGEAANNAVVVSQQEPLKARTQG